MLRPSWSMIVGLTCLMFPRPGHSEVTKSGGQLAVSDEEIELEYELLTPVGEGLKPGVVVCHPDPRLGGSFKNHIVSGLAEALAAKGFVALKFNFRGVGKSTGKFDEGKGERRDVAAALNKLRSVKGVDHGKVFVAGYSFGSAMAFDVALNDKKVRAYAGIGYPNDYFKHKASDYPNGKLPVLMIGGVKDPWCRIEALGVVMKKGGINVQTIAVEGTDHFFGDETSLSTAVNGVAAFFENALSQSP